MEFMDGDGPVRNRMRGRPGHPSSVGSWQRSKHVQSRCSAHGGPSIRPPGIGTDAFARLVEQAIDRIPKELRACLENVVISVQRRPSLELLADMGLLPDETLFGVYLGVPLTERIAGDPPLYPDMIHIFQEPLEAHCAGREQLLDEIELTVVHEIAHFFGFDDAELDDLGYSN